ncbi:TraA [Rhodococcus aetherivorans]|nr:TraA [Rhodococcus aetherivorans]
MADLAERAGATAPATVLLAELDRIAADGRDLTHPDAPGWIIAPVTDADHLDPDLAAQIREDYQTIADLRRDYRNQLTDDTAPTWAQSTLGRCPDDPEHAALWRTTIADAAAYRSTHHITDEDTLTGGRPNDRRAALDWMHVERQRARLHEQQLRQQQTRDQELEHRAHQPGLGHVEQRDRRV